MRSNKRRKARAFLDAVVLGDAATVMAMLIEGVPIETRDPEHEETALMLAVQFGRDVTIPLLLLEAGADTNANDATGRTPLMVAKAVFVPELFAAGAHINAQDENGETALMKAAGSAQIEKVRALLENGADITLRDHDGSSAWDHANRLGYKVLTDLPELYC